MSENNPGMYLEEFADDWLNDSSHLDGGHCPRDCRFFLSGFTRVLTNGLLLRYL